MVTTTKGRGTCDYCDQPSITLRPMPQFVGDKHWCAVCRGAARVGGGQTDAERMRELLDRLEAATSAGLRADDLEVSLIVDEWRDLKRHERAA